MSGPRRSNTGAAPLPQVEPRPSAPVQAMRTTSVETALQIETLKDDDLLRTRQEDTAMSGPPPAPDMRRRPCLVALSGANEGEIFELPTNHALVIGRAPEAPICLDDEGVSRAHARITVDDDGILLEDLNSRNGTFVGQVRIARRYLAIDDLVRLGSASILKLRYIDGVEEQFRLRLVSAAMRDGLTGLHNRRHFDERLTSETASARRHRRPLSLLLVDIDDFKRVNDTLGHASGDAVLRAVAAVLERSVREEDLVFRYGGEEFAVLLRETDLDGALRVAERVRGNVSTAIVSEPGTSPLRVTVSIGAAELMAGVDQLALIQNADAALYRAKREGRNRVIAAR